MRENLGNALGRQAGAENDELRSKRRHAGERSIASEEEAAPCFPNACTATTLGFLSAARPRASRWSWAIASGLVASFGERTLMATRRPNPNDTKQ